MSHGDVSIRGKSAGEYVPTRNGIDPGTLAEIARIEKAICSDLQ